MSTFNYEDDFLKDLQNYELDELVEKAENVVLGFAATTGATGAIPIPFADAPLLVSQQVAMIVAINSVFEIEIEEDVLISLVMGVIGVGGATVVGKTVVTNLMKCIPGVGTLAGSAISAGTAGVLTLALGHAYIQLCKDVKMGKLNQTEITKKAGMDRLKKAFKDEMKKEQK